MLQTLPFPRAHTDYLFFVGIQIPFDAVKTDKCLTL